MIRNTWFCLFSSLSAALPLSALLPRLALAAYAAPGGADGAGGQSAAPVLPAVAPVAPVATPVAGTAPQAAAPAGNLLPAVNLSWSGYFEALAILCFILAMLWAALWLIRRLGGGKGFFTSSTPSLRVESRLALGPKKWILVVRYLDRRLLVGVTDEHISLLTELPAQEPPAEESGAGRMGKGRRASAPGGPDSGGPGTGGPGGPGGLPLPGALDLFGPEAGGLEPSDPGRSRTTVSAARNELSFKDLLHKGPGSS